MPIELTPDYFPEIMLKLTEILEGMKRMKNEISEKDKKIAELEAKLKEKKDGS